MSIKPGRNRTWRSRWGENTPTWAPRCVCSSQRSCLRQQAAPAAQPWASSCPPSPGSGATRQTAVEGPSDPPPAAPLRRERWSDYWRACGGVFAGPAVSPGVSYPRASRGPVCSPVDGSPLRVTVPSTRGRHTGHCAEGLVGNSCLETLPPCCFLWHGRVRGGLGASYMGPQASP